MEYERGLVIGLSWEMVGTAHRRDAPTQKEEIWVPYCGRIDPLVRRALLYFDRLQLPLYDFFTPPDLLHAEHLVSRGVLTEVHTTFSINLDTYGDSVTVDTPRGRGVVGSAIMRMVGTSHIGEFKRLEAETPGGWSLATIGGHAFEVPLDLAINQRGFEVELRGLLPIPTDEVSYEDILEFKLHNKPELLALRSYLDDIYLRVIDSRDFPRARNIELQKLENALGDVRKSLTDRRLRYHLETAGVEFSLGELVELGKGAAEVFLGHEAHSIPMLLLGAASLLKFAPKISSSPVKRMGPMKYVYRAGQESIVNPSSIGVAHDI